MGKELFKGYKYITTGEWKPDRCGMRIEKGTKFECIDTDLINEIRYPHIEHKRKIKIINGKQAGIELDVWHDRFSGSPFVRIPDSKELTKESFISIIKNTSTSYCFVYYYDEFPPSLKQYPGNKNEIKRENDFCFLIAKDMSDGEEEGHMGAVWALDKIRESIKLLYGINCNFVKIGSHESCGWKLSNEKDPSLPCGSVYKTIFITIP